MKVAVYGTLRQECGNNILLNNSRFLGRTLTKDQYTMRSFGGCPFVSKTDPTSRITVEVYEVSPETLSRLDRLEGYRDENDHWYNRTPTETIDFGEALMYHIDGRQGPIIPSGDWVEHRKSGYQ